MKLLFSVYKTDVWKFGKDGVYFAIGPFRFTDRAFLDATGGADDRVPPLLERAVDYEHSGDYWKDKFTVYLEDGSVAEREFARRHFSKWNENLEKEEQFGRKTETAVNFHQKLKERCGY